MLSSGFEMDYNSIEADIRQCALERYLYVAERYVSLRRSVESVSKTQIFARNHFRSAGKVGRVVF